MQPWLLLCAVVLQDAPLGPGDHLRTLDVDGRERSYVIHIPAKYEPGKPAPVVLAYHGTAMSGRQLQQASGLDDKSDETGFIAVYPNGTGSDENSLTFNAGEHVRRAADPAFPDDVAFTARLLDDLAMVVNVDAKRVYATGVSNGAMMCYRLAAELSNRIAAIAPVAGSMAIAEFKPVRAVSIVHFHGTADLIVPYGGPNRLTPKFVTFKSVDETLRLWAEANGCGLDPVDGEEPDTVDDGTTVERSTWGPGKDGAEIVLYLVQGGGHTWPGREFPLKFVGRATRDISANDVMWTFFEKHPLP